ncbi:MAG: hypothetical protein OHK0046_12480 [Anaerolineae bacterium]
MGMTPMPTPEVLQVLRECALDDNAYQKLLETFIHAKVNSWVSDQNHLDAVLEQERVRILSEFIRGASHEFRTPLSVVQSSAYLLAKTDDAEKKAAYVNKINEMVGIITALIDNLVMLAALDSHVTFKQDTISLNMLVKQLTDTMTSALQRARVQLTLHLQAGLPMIKGDTNKLGLALRNMIENAIQHSRLDGQITIRTAQEGSFALVDIQDEGRGIPPETLEHIFERFFRGEDDHAVGGFGLGLTITHKIIERHRGTIEVQSEVGKGSLFRLRLPIG